MADLDQTAKDAIHQPERTVTVLTVGDAADEHVSLRSILTHSNWRLFEAASCAEARAILERQRVSVVVCDELLPDGDWKQVLRTVEALPVSPPLIVTARNADDLLWSEVLNLGGYDLLPKPFDFNEVVRAVGIAWLHWKDSLTLFHPARGVGELTASPLS
jgi:two-component system nitrogen regulation response regulator GlnG